MTLTPLARRTAVVTGAGRGIGRATALRLAVDGASLVLNDLDDGPIDELAAEIVADGGAATVLCGDTSDPRVARALVAEAYRRFGAIDILVNNAGRTRDRMFHRLTDDDLEQALDANLRTAWQTTHAVVAKLRPILKAELAATGSVSYQRKIVFTASVSALTGNLGQANYTVAKGGLIALTKTLAQELGPFGINVNAVAPGFIETRLTAPRDDESGIGIPDERRATIRAMIALGHFGRPEDVANVTAFLASSDSDYVSGVTLPVTGGQLGGMG